MAKFSYRRFLKQWRKEPEQKRNRLLDSMPEDKRVELEKQIELDILPFVRFS